VTVLPAAAKNLSALTSIRFLAALRVAMYHLVNWDNRTYWWRVLGQSSFALYMLHAPLLIFATWYFANRIELGHIGRLAVVAVIVALSLALYKWVEAPLTAKLRKSLFHSAAAAPKYSELGDTA